MYVNTYKTNIELNPVMVLMSQSPLMLWGDTGKGPDWTQRHTRIGAGFWNCN